MPKNEVPKIKVLESEEAAQKEIRKYPFLNLGRDIIVVELSQEERHLVVISDTSDEISQTLYDAGWGIGNPQGFMMGSCVFSLPYHRSPITELKILFPGHDIELAQTS